MRLERMLEERTAAAIGAYCLDQLAHGLVVMPFALVGRAAGFELEGVLAGGGVLLVRELVQWFGKAEKRRVQWKAQGPMLLADPALDVLLGMPIGWALARAAVAAFGG